jgi:uncharacterized lipoprotein YmbA
MSGTGSRSGAARLPRRRGRLGTGGVALCVLAAAALLAACGSNKPPRFHALLGAGTVGTQPAQPAASPVPGPLQVDLARVGVPPQVDQAQWLVRLPDQSLALLEAERWASPLRDELRHALLGLLVERHGAVDARTTGGEGAPWRIDVEVRRFESIPGLEARIEGAWSATRRAPAASVRCTWAFHEPVGDGMLALAAGHRKALERLADAIAASLQAASRGATAVCPTGE